MAKRVTKFNAESPSLEKIAAATMSLQDGIETVGPEARRTTQDRHIQDIEKSIQECARDVAVYLQSIGFKVPVEEIVSKLYVQYHTISTGAEWSQRELTQRQPDGTKTKSYVNVLQVPRHAFGDEEHFRRHEIGHATSREELVETKSGSFSRSGLSSHADPEGFFTDSEKNVLFEALNEAITDEVARRATTGQSTWTKMFFRLFFSEARAREREMLSIICRNIAKFEQEKSEGSVTPDDVFREFVNAWLYGWSKSLKKRLLEAFGSDTLKILAVLDPQTGAFTQGPESLGNSDTWKAVKTYFDLSTSPEKRVEAKKKILATHEKRRK